MRLGESEIHYQIRPHDLTLHLFEVTLTVASPSKAGQEFSLPAWIPGSYMIRDFARNIVQIKAESKGKPVLAIGKKAGMVNGMEIKTEPVQTDEVDTVTLYLNPLHQKPYYDYILSLKPRRIIFNPGTENDELESIARKAGIEITEACTLVMLSTGQY